MTACTIEEDAQHKAEELLKLKRCQNNLAPISRLPPELLTRSFAWLVEDFAFRSPEDWNSQTIQWVKITHVCHHWREVALNSPHLWSILVNFKPKWAEIQLERSKQASLYLHLRPVGNVPQQTACLRKALDYSYRLRSLRVSAFSCGPALTRILDDDNFPRLQSLVIDGTTTGTVVPYPILPEAFIFRKAPHLQRLELEKWVLPWTCPIFERLTSLKLTARRTLTPPGAAKDFFDALERMSKIVELELDICLPDALSLDLAAPSRQIRMVNLEKLVLHALIGQCSAILNHISIPATASIHLFARGTDYSDMFYDVDEICSLHLPPLVASIHSAWLSNPLCATPSSDPCNDEPTPKSLSLQSAHVVNGTSGYFLVSIPNQHLTKLVNLASVRDVQRPDFHPSALSFSVTTKPDLDDTGIQTINQHLTSLFTLSSLKTVVMKSWFSLTTWSNLRDLRTLECIFLNSRDAGVRFIKCISADPIVQCDCHYQGSDDDGSLRDTATSITFPKLKVLSIMDVDFTSLTNVDIQWDAFLTFLESRHDIGKDISRIQLFLHDCTFSEEQYRELKVAVAQVELFGS
ncbi:hypothetical protein CVT24_004994 [Panaeolus cyanescens]|uniref:Uncharacterized protein n=1 Tax=Panaeolus cyanescens TaxID=181874 RepID=A0A409V9P6_9AGAR|nr:hypothetical protein CVT24_004994 [Panaeolus cyanescens]